MTQHTEDPTIEAVRLLRESGYHEAAADLATKALQRVTATMPVAPAPGAPAGQEPAKTRDEVQGEQLLESLNTSRTPWHTAGDL